MQAPGPFTLEEVSIRLGLALVAGTLLGFERESKGRAAGLKTTILVCMAAAVAMVLSEKYYRDSFLTLGTDSTWRPDPARLAAGILSGMGFIGGGVIIQQGSLVRGVTTASVLWFVTVIGFCFGSGYWQLGLMGTVIGLLVLYLLPMMEHYVANDSYGTLTVTTHESGPRLKDLQRVLEELKFQIKSAEWKIDIKEDFRTFHFTLKYKNIDLLQLQDQVIKTVGEIPGIEKVSWEI